MKKCKGEAPGSTQTEKRNPTQKAWGVRGHAPEDTDRANAALSPVNSSLLETDPKHTGEEPSGAPDATRCARPTSQAEAKDKISSLNQETELLFFTVFRDEGDVAPLSQEGITSARTSMA